MDTSLHLLPPPGETISLVGEAVRGAGWYGHTSGLHTVAIRVLNFQGRVSVQASIATVPTETDWYSVLPGVVEFIQYPQPGYLMPSNNTGETSVGSFNFATNAVWLRATVDRSYLIPPLSSPLQIMPFGTVSYILVNY
jgi:hypothetical protein